MKRTVLLIAALAMVFSFQDAQSQSLRKMVKQRIFKEPVEIKSKEDSMTVLVIDDPTESSSTHFSNEATMKAFGLTDNVAHDTKYDFDAYIQMEISDYKKNGKLDDQVVYDNYMHKQDADYAMEFIDGDDKTTMIFDTKNSAMLILTDADGEKTGFATTIDPEALAGQVEDYEGYEEENDVVPPNIKKTGKTKTILGYKCDEYLMEDEESEVHMWISEKLGKEMQKEWMNNQQTFGAMFTQAYSLNGMTLEYEMIEKNGEKSIMQVTKIDLNHSHKISTDGYAIMSMRQQTEEEKQ
jgi:hypothetical protein